jgi:hypothetical protein
MLVASGRETPLPHGPNGLQYRKASCSITTNLMSTGWGSARGDVAVSNSMERAVAKMRSSTTEPLPDFTVALTLPARPKGLDGLVI